MKRFLSRNILLGLTLFFIIPQLNAQNNASVYWSLAETDGQNVSAESGNVTGLMQEGSPGFVVRDYSSGPGPDQRWWPYDGSSAVQWGDETGQNDERWVQFALLPGANFNFHAEELSIYIGAKGTGNIKANLYVSTEVSFSDAVKLNAEELSLVKDTDSLYNFSLNTTVSSGDTLFVRIYPWYTGSPSTSKYLYLRQATISGTTSGVTYPASAQWELTNPADGGTGLEPALAGQVDAEDEYLNNMEINQYSGPNFSQRVRIEGNSWPALQTTQIDTVFIQFAVSPKTGFNLRVTSLSLGIAAASINTMKANIYYSTDPDFATSEPVEYTTPDTSGNNYLGREELAPVHAEPNLIVNSGETFYLRIYPWVDNDPSERTGKYVCIQDVVIAGEIEGNPTPAAVVWPFESDDSPVTSGPVIAQDQSYSDAMKFYWSQFPVLPASDGSGDKVCGAIQTVSKIWNYESEPADSLYFQYAVSPKFGGTFYIDSISMYIGGWFSSNIKAEFYYSKYESFTDKTLLIADTALVGNSVMPLKAELSETVNSGETFYLRVYPHNVNPDGEGWAKLVALSDVKISGTTSGVTADPPTVITDDVSGISTTFASSGGNVPTDGGSAVLARGVVWNDSGSPTINDSKTVDGAGSGSFDSFIKGLTPGTDYYVRAYATNDAGTTYGEEKTFRTLDSTIVPTVHTSSVSNILVESASTGGTVSDWGGDSVIARGVVWNSSGEPTLDDSYTLNGSGLGNFTSTLYPLEGNTTYYVRAYATNSKGTGYGELKEFTTQSPAPAVLKVVAADGSGDYTTVQAAFDDIPDYYTGEYRIFVKNGTYYEKLLLDRNKTNVILEGESVESTILTYDDYAGIAGGTSMSYSVGIDADDFTAMNITFQNTVVNDGSVNDQQGVALRVNGDRQAYYNCRLLGYQDTYYTWGGRGTGRTYMKNCYIEGSVDFIFGRNVVLFDSCEIHINRNGGTLTAASTEPETKFGYVFLDNIISADSIGFNGDPITSFILGRPWQKSPRTVFINCYEPASLSAAGWSTWNTIPGLYAEYNCYGPGSDFSNRLTSISRQLTDEEATEYTIENIFAKTTNPDFGYDWLPEKPLLTGVEDNLTGQIPEKYNIFQNYPNPFNPTTTIQYQLPSESKVKIRIFNILGETVKVLVNQVQEAGYYRANFSAAGLASGIYFYHIAADPASGSGKGINMTKKMLLLK